MKRWWLSLVFAVCALLLATCDGGGAVVFAPTPLPPDESPLAYVHPGGAFQIDVPRRWSLYEQYTTQLASASFAPPGADEPLLSVSAVNLGANADTLSFADQINRYQTQIRPDLARYTELDRAPMGDGSWRISGYRTLPGGQPQALNTFIERAGPLLAVTELLLPDDPALLRVLEAAANSLRLTPPGSLEDADMTALSFTRPSELSVLHTTAWTAPDGVFYVTGEVANDGPVALAEIPVEVVLTTTDGAPLVGAVDRVMGHVLPPGGFAPFSLRFGGGQPDAARGFRVQVGGEGWTPADAPVLAGPDVLSWTDNATFGDDGALTVSGEVANASSQPIRSLRAVVTVFDAAQNVIGAAYTDVMPSTLAPGERAPYRFVFTELGGQPVNYIVSVQGLE